MELVVFSSGSSGNCSLIKTKKDNILIDVGISKKQIEANLELSGLKLEDITKLLITHEHTDHVKAFQSLLKFENIIIYATRGTMNAVYKTLTDKNKELCKKRVNENTIILLNKLEKSILYPNILLNSGYVSVIPTFHDAAESIGFVICDEDKKIVYITDTGYVHNELFEVISNADCYVLESNHDPELLRLSPRPYSTIVRILSDHGHLSNEDSMVVLASVMGEKTKTVIHAHISQECNLSQIITLTRKKVLGDYGINYDDVKFVIASTLRSEVFKI